MTARRIDISCSGRNGLYLNRLPLFIAALWSLFCLPVTAFAAGTSAGSIISNSATVIYTMSGSSHTQISNVNTFMVDDKVSFTLTAADAANVTITPGDRAYLTCILTNTGNAPHDFTLNAAVAGTSGFSPAAGPALYADAAGTTLLPTDVNAASLPYLGSLPPDAARTVYLYITAPAQLTDGQTIAYLITAEAYQPAHLGTVNPPLKSATQAAVDSTVNKNTNLLTRYVVLADAHGNGGDADRDGKYALIAKDGSNNTIGFKARSAAVNVVKAATITDRAGGSQPASGSTVRYSLEVSAAGSGTALGVVIADPIPINTSYTAGTIRLNGTSLSDAADGDAGDMGGTSAGTVTVRLGDMTSASPVQVIDFEVKID